MTATDSTTSGAGTTANTATSNTAATDTERAALSEVVTGAPACPKCGGRMWDNRATKRNPKAPDFKCRDRRCDGVLWPGQHKSAEPILTPRFPVSSADAPADDTGREPEGQPAAAAPEAATATGQGSVPAPTARRATTTAARDARATLRRCYLDVTDFVLSEVRPKYADAGLPCTDATVAAIAATLFIQTCRPMTAAGREGQ